MTTQVRRLPEGYEHLFPEVAKSVRIVNSFYANRPETAVSWPLPPPPDLDFDPHDADYMRLETVFDKLGQDRKKMQDFLRKAITLMLEDLGDRDPNRAEKMGIWIALKRHFDPDDPFVKELLKKVFQQWPYTF